MNPQRGPSASLGMTARKATAKAKASPLPADSRDANGAKEVSYI
jgi:hypothetical protein